MALHDLLTALEREAEAKAELELAAAHAAAARIASDAGERLERRRAAFVAARQAESAAATAVILTEARRRMRARVLEARQRLLDRVFEAAREELPKAASDPGFLQRLPQQVARARHYLPAGAVTARCRPEFAAALRTVGDAGLTVVAEETAGTGVQLISADGSVEVDETLEARLERSRPELAIAVVRRVEGR